jgi:hypothetical protein
LPLFGAVAQLLIRFRRPASVAETEVPAWIERRARGRHPVLGRARLAGSDSEAWVLGVRLVGDLREAADERLSDLLMDVPPPPRAGALRQGLAS